MRLKRPIRIAINGFGRIGRALFRICMKDPMIEIVMINDPRLTSEDIAYLCKYDSLYGVLADDIIPKDKSFFVNGKQVALHHIDLLQTIPFNEYDIDILVQAHGNLTNLKQQICFLEKAPFHTIFTNHVHEGHVRPFVYGAEKIEVLASLKIVSLSTCDVGAVLPVYKMLAGLYGIYSASIITLHPYLSSQNVLDGKSPNDEVELGRSVFNTLIPKPTSLESILKEYFPDQRENIMAMSFRIPTNTVSNAIMNLHLQNDVEKETLQTSLATWCQTSCPSVGLYSEDRGVSVDYKQTSQSFIIDHRWINCTKNHARISIWYDNEWGYASRVYDCLRHLTGVN